MEEKYIKRLWHLCELIQDFCETHNDCNYCPFHSGFEGCKIRSDTDFSPVNLCELFPENIDLE